MKERLVFIVYHLTSRGNRINLGAFESEAEAIAEARKGFFVEALNFLPKKRRTANHLPNTVEKAPCEADVIGWADEWDRSSDAL